MRGQFIIEHLVADFAKDEVLAVKLAFWVDIDGGQQDRPVRQRIPTLAIGKDVFVRRKKLKGLALSARPQDNNKSYPYDARLNGLHAMVPFAPERRCRS